MNRLFVRERYNRDLLQKAIATAALPEDWREYFLPRLNGPAVSDLAAEPVLIAKSVIPYNSE